MRCEDCPWANFYTEPDTGFTEMICTLGGTSCENEEEEEEDV